MHESVNITVAKTGYFHQCKFLRIIDHDFLIEESKLKKAH